MHSVDAVPSSAPSALIGGGVVLPAPAGACARPVSGVATRFHFRYFRCRV